MQRAIRLSPGRLRSSENNEYVNNVMRIETMEIVVSTKLRYDSNSSSPKGIGFLQKFKLYQIVLKSFFVASLPDFDTGVNAAIK